jgi:hypothetical protein
VAAAWDGIYIAYMTGAEGQGIAMYLFQNGKITGADPWGVLFDGDYHVGEDGQLVGEVTVTVPPNGEVIQGVSSGPSGIVYKVPISFSGELAAADFIRVETPLGPINLKMKKVRNLDPVG